MTVDHRRPVVKAKIQSVGSTRPPLELSNFECWPEKQESCDFAPKQKPSRIWGIQTWSRFRRREGWGATLFLDGNDFASRYHSI